MITREQLIEMSKQDIETINREELVDISHTRIMRDLPHDKKVLAFLKEIKNPYCFLCGDIAVRVCFSDSGPDLTDALQDYFIRIKQS